MKRLWFVCVLLMLASRARGQRDQPVRLAVVAGSEPASTLADVLTARLSQNDRIQLLERGEIAKVYREQQLSAGNRNLVQLGRMLGADGVLLLETSPQDTNGWLGVRLVAVKTGVLLMSERGQRPAGDPSDWASGLARFLEPLLPKLAVPQNDALPLSVVNLRSALQSPEERQLERNLTLLTIDRLSQEPRLFVLERRRMELLTAEKDLGGVDDSAFWSGSYLVEGTIDRDGYSADKVTVSARLVPPQGRAPVSIELAGSRTNLAEIVRQLTGRILENLNIGAGGSPWDPAGEAARYEDEARWALRWKLYEAAQAASESAWALGRRNRDLAAVRVRAWSESIWPINETVGNILVPALPDPALLKTCTRAATLYAEDSPMVLTNSVKTDLDWFDAGVKLFERAAGLLDGFYEAAEFRRGNEEALAELRAASREMLPVLETQAAALPDHFVRSFNRLRQLEWEQGGVCFEKPDGPLPFYRSVLETGFIPDTVPRIIGWSWEDRKRAPAVLKRFIGELYGSTNADVRLAGLYLSVLRTPDDGTGSLEAAEGRLLDGIWEQRTNLFTSLEKASFLRKTRDALQKKYYHYAEKPFDQEQYTNFLGRLREDAPELLPALEQFKKLNGSYDDHDFWMKILVEQKPTVYPRRTQPVAHVASPQGEHPESVRFLPWNLTPDQPDPELHPQLEWLVSRKGSLWGMICYVGGFNMPIKSPTCFVLIDQETGHCREFAFPQQLGYPHPNFDVTTEFLYTSLDNQLARCRIATKTWDTIPLPTESAGDVVALKGRVYFANADTLLEIDPGTRAIQVLASSRRQPPVNEMDSLWGANPGPRNSPWEVNPGLFAAGSKHLGVQTGNFFCLFDLDTRVWEKVEMPQNPPGLFTARFFSSGGMQLLSWAASLPRANQRVVGFSANHPGAELLLEQLPADRAGPRITLPALGQPRWNWPDAYDLKVPGFNMEGEDLWALQPRRLYSLGRPPKEQVQFDDDRNATLLRFGAGVPDPLAISLRFEREGRAYDPCLPFGKRINSSGWIMHLPGVPLWLMTEKGLVLSSADEHPGHWFVPKSLLDQRWQDFRSQVQQQARLPAPGRPGSETNSAPH